MRTKDDPAAIEAAIHGIMDFARGMEKFPHMGPQETVKFYLAWLVLTAMVISLPALFLVMLGGLYVWNSRHDDTIFFVVMAAMAAPSIYVLWFVVPGRYMRWRHRAELRSLENAIDRHAITRSELEEAIRRCPPFGRDSIRYGLKGRLLALCRENGLAPPRS